MKLRPTLRQRAACLAATSSIFLNLSPALAQQISILTPLSPPSSMPSTLNSQTTFYLPGYGTVRVGWGTPPAGGSVPQVVLADFPSLNNVSIPSSPNTILGPSVRLLGFYPNGTDRDYRVTFFFDSGPVDLNKLQLLVHNLGVNSSGGSTRVTPSLIPTYGATYVNQNAGGQPLQIVNGVISQNHATGTPIDAVNGNSGIGNFPFSTSSGPILNDSNGTPYFQLSVKQLGNDQIALTLGYEQCYCKRP